MVPNGNIWAPDINMIGDKYVMYYSKSAWGGEWECGIGVATATKPQGPFTDEGKLFISSEIGVQNSIDPFYIEEEDGSKTDVVTFPGLSVDKVKYVVTVDGSEVYMPPKELELLFFLASNPNRVYSREQLLENVWGYDFFGESRTVDVHIKRLREKINDHDNWRIATIWGIGYKFEVQQ
jgi:DNA-binding response OmpR family regulator